MTDTIYTAPRAELAQPRDLSGYGSLERGIAGDYPFSIRAILQESWDKTRGAKLTLNLAWLVYFVIYVVAALVLGFAAGSLSFDPAAQQQGFTAAGIAVNVVVTVIGMTLMLGIMLMGIRRAVDAPIAVTQVFSAFPRIVPLVVTLVLLYLMVAIGLVLLVIPGIYLMVAYYLALPLVVEKNIEPWQALEASRKALSKHWFRTFGLGLAVTLINVATIFTLGIGLIWTVPMSMIAFGILYRNVFGVEPSTAAG